MSPTELQRIADAIHRLRPDWPVASLRTFLEINLSTRAYRDVALALTWVACDPLSRTPKRVLQAGPWWQANPASEPANTTTAIVNGRCTRCRWFHAPGAPCEPPRPANPDIAAVAVRKAREAIITALPPRDQTKRGTP